MRKGSALIVVVLVTVVLAALGLGIATLGALESETARHGLASRQASLAAEAGLRSVKHWFDAPAGSAGAWRVPSAADVDRSVRRVDPEGDGSFVPFAAAPAPWNVVYRQGGDDLFERPYRGAPSLSLEGDSRGPDILIAADATAPGPRAFLAHLSVEMFGAVSGPGTARRLTRIAVYAPPRVTIAGTSARLGIATVEVTAAVVHVSVDGETTLAVARAGGLLQEIPYSAPGPLTARVIEVGSGLDVRWGTIATAGDVDLGPDPAAATRAGWPWRSLTRRLIADTDGDGTSDDTDGDGTGDLAEWIGLPDAGIPDPWFRLLAGGSIAAAPWVAAQPFPFDPGRIPGSYTTGADRSALFQSVAGAATFAPGAHAALFRAAAADGGPSAHLFRYVPGTTPPLFKEGEGAPVGLEDATRGREGLFYFDTADGSAPRDTNGDGTLDNLTPAIVLADPGWWTAGCLFVNASSFSLPRGSSRAGSVQVAPPGEPFADLDGDGSCGASEPYLQLVYPTDPLSPGAIFTRIGVSTPLAGRPPLPQGASFPAPHTLAGLLLVGGRLEGPSSARIFGAIAVSGAVSVPDPGMGEKLQILYDTRLAHDAWPPPTSRLPRTLWQRRWVAP